MPQQARIEWLEAYELCRRVEPLVQLMEVCIQNQQYKLGYYYGKIACELPDVSEIGVYVDREAYQYKRYHYLSCCSMAVQDFLLAKEMSEKAISARNLDIDKVNKKTIDNLIQISNTK